MMREIKEGIRRKRENLYFKNDELNKHKSTNRVENPTLLNTPNLKRRGSKVKNQRQFLIINSNKKYK